MINDVPLFLVPKLEHILVEGRWDILSTFEIDRKFFERKIQGREAPEAASLHYASCYDIN